MEKWVNMLLFHQSKKHRLPSNKYKQSLLQLKATNSVNCSDTFGRKS